MPSYLLLFQQHQPVSQINIQISLLFNYPVPMESLDGYCNWPLCVLGSRKVYVMDVMINMSCVFV